MNWSQTILAQVDSLESIFSLIREFGLAAFIAVLLGIVVVILIRGESRLQNAGAGSSETLAKMALQMNEERAVTSRRMTKIQEVIRNQALEIKDLRHEIKSLKETVQDFDNLQAENESLKTDNEMLRKQRDYWMQASFKLAPSTQKPKVKAKIIEMKQQDKVA